MNDTAGTLLTFTPSIPGHVTVVIGELFLYPILPIVLVLLAGVLAVVTMHVLGVNMITY